MLKPTKWRPRAARIYEDRVRRAVNTPDRNGRFALWQGGMEPNIPVGSARGVASSMEKAKLFRIALTVAEMTLQDWAAAQEPPVAPVTVYELLKGRMTSARLTEAQSCTVTPRPGCESGRSTRTLSCGLRALPPHRTSTSS